MTTVDPVKKAVTDYNNMIKKAYFAEFKKYNDMRNQLIPELQEEFSMKKVPEHCFLHSAAVTRLQNSPNPFDKETYIVLPPKYDVARKITDKRSSLTFDKSGKYAKTADGVVPIHLSHLFVDWLADITTKMKGRINYITKLPNDVLDKISYQMTNIGKVQKQSVRNLKLALGENGKGMQSPITDFNSNHPVFIKVYTNLLKKHKTDDTVEEILKKGKTALNKYEKYLKESPYNGDFEDSDNTDYDKFYDGSDGRDVLKAHIQIIDNAISVYLKLINVSSDNTHLYNLLLAFGKKNYAYKSFDSNHGFKHDDPNDQENKASDANELFTLELAKYYTTLLLKNFSNAMIIKTDECYEVFKHIYNIIGYYHPDITYTNRHTPWLYIAILYVYYYILVSLNAPNTAKIFEIFETFYWRKCPLEKRVSTISATYLSKVLRQGENLSKHSELTKHALTFFESCKNFILENDNSIAEYDDDEIAMLKSIGKQIHKK